MKISVQTIKNILIFMLVNLIGFYIGPFIYALVMIKFQLIDIETSQFTMLDQEEFIWVATMTWLVCAVFSFSIFFNIGKWKRFFIAAPIVLPLIYSIFFFARYI